jgi:hypothetical protein
VLAASRASLFHQAFHSPKKNKSADQIKKIHHHQVTAHNRRNDYKKKNNNLAYRRRPGSPLTSERVQSTAMSIFIASRFHRENIRTAILC